MSFGARWARLRKRFPLSRMRERLSTPEGRQLLAGPASWLFWPVLAPLAALARRTVLRGVRVVAVTGSFGKSTTTRAIAAALGVGSNAQGRNFGSALALALLRARRRRTLVLEVGISAPGQMRGYARLLRPDVVVVTSIGHEHVRALGDLDGVVREKGELVAGLRDGGVAILDGDEPRSAALAARRPGGRTVRCGLGPGNDPRAESIRLEWPPATRFELVAGGEAWPVRLRLVGEPMVRAALAAMAVARELGVPAAEALDRIEQLEPTPGRLEPRPLATGAWVLADDFKAGVETIDRALETLAALPARRRLVVIGDVEEPPKPADRYYRELGRRIAGVAERVAVIGHNFEMLRRGLRAGGLADGAIVKCAGYVEIPAALGPLGDGDLVLVKGRMELKLERAVRLLVGDPVACRIPRCSLISHRCSSCPALLRAVAADLSARPSAAPGREPC